MGWKRPWKGNGHGADDASWDHDVNMGDDEQSQEFEDAAELRGLIARSDDRLPAVLHDDSGPLIVPGDGVSMGMPIIKRRERPLTVRLAMLTVMAMLLLTGLFSITPLGANGPGQVTSFQALAGSVIWSNNVGYVWYTVEGGDTVESVSKKFHVQIGGIYELNSLIAGEDLQVGSAYKIPTDPNYGKNYRPPSYIVTSSATGGNVFGSNWWNSVSGAAPKESPCGPDGHGNPLAYHLHSPNWNSGWVRGFSWFHNGDDTAAPNGNPIHAAQAGQAVWAGWDGTNGLGWSIKLNNCNGISTLYGHMQKILIKPGDFVQAGDVIGLEGSTGWATGPHLHFMVEVDNNIVDPFPYFTGTYSMTHYVG